MKKTFFLLLLLLTQNNIFSQYDPNKPLNTQTYEFYKGADWTSDSSNYIVELEIQEAMLEYKKCFQSFTPEQKQLFSELEQLTDKMFKLCYKWHTNTTTDSDLTQADKVNNEWLALNTKLDALISQNN